MKRAVITGLLAIWAVCLVVGCGKKEENTQESEGTKTEQTDNQDKEQDKQDEEQDNKEEEKEDGKDGESEKEAEEYQVIGTESEDSYKLLLTNHTGEAITGFSVKTSLEAEFPENMMEPDMKIENDETVCVYYAAPETEDAESSSGKLLRTTYEFNISNESGREIRFFGLMFDDFEQAELCFEDEVGFIRYVSLDSGEEISTKEMALSLQQLQ